MHIDFAVNHFVHVYPVLSLVTKIARIGKVCSIFICVSLFLRLKKFLIKNDTKYHFAYSMICDLKAITNKKRKLDHCKNYLIYALFYFIKQCFYFLCCNFWFFFIKIYLLRKYLLIRFLKKIYILNQYPLIIGFFSSKIKFSNRFFLYV